MVMQDTLENGGIQSNGHNQLYPIVIDNLFNLTLLSLRLFHARQRHIKITAHLYDKYLRK